MCTSPHTAQYVHHDFTTIYSICVCCTSELLPLGLSHLPLTFLVVYYLPLCPTFVMDFRISLNQLNKASGNEKNKSALSEDFSHFQFPPLCYKQCIIYLKPAMLCFFSRKHKHHSLFKKVISELSAKASSD